MMPISTRPLPTLPNKRTLVIIVAALISISIWTICSLDLYSRNIQKTETSASLSQLKIVNDSMTTRGASPQSGDAIVQQHQCLQSDKELDELIRNAEQIVITMPAKAGGTTAEKFVKECTNRSIVDNFLNFDYAVMGELMLGQPLSVPKIIASHMDSDKPLRGLIEQLPASALLIYMHREESTRLLSAVNQAYSDPRIQNKYCDIFHNATTSTCIVGEKNLISSIQAKEVEIGLGDTKMLTCDTYDAIKNNAPNMYFVNYKQGDMLQRALAKYHCPHMLEKDTVRINTAAGKVNSQNVKVRLHSDSNDQPAEDVDLPEWLKAKGQMLQFALGLRNGAQPCQSSTREMEKALFACETQIVHV